MLSDRDRAELQEIRRRMLAEDPDFVQRFERAPRARRPLEKPALLPGSSRGVVSLHTACTFLLWLFLVLLGIALLGGATGTASLFALFVAVAWVTREVGGPRPPTT